LKRLELFLKIASQADRGFTGQGLRAGPAVIEAVVIRKEASLVFTFF
jgi:hypothetical protein